MAEEITLTGFEEAPNALGQIEGRAPSSGPAPIEPPGVRAELSEALTAFREDSPAAPDARTEISQVLSGFREEQERRRANPEQQLDFASGIVTSEQSQRRSRAMALSKEAGIPADVAEAYLMEMTPEEIIAKSRTSDIARNYPVLARWGSNPENNSIIARNAGWTQGVNKTFEQLNPKKRSDFQKVISNSLIDYRQAVIDIGMVMGSLSLEEGKALLREADEERAANEYLRSAPGMARFMRELQDTSRPFGEFLRGVVGAYDAAMDGKVETEVLPALQQAASAGVDLAGEVWDVLTSLYEDPYAASVFGLQAIMSSAPAIGAGLLGGAAGARAGGKLGAVVGSFASAGAASFPLEFSGKLREQWEEFRDPETGEIDYDAAFSDPKRVALWRKEAGVFASVMAASDAFYSLVIGKPFMKLARKVPGKATGVAAGVAAEAVTGGVEEAASNLTATIASRAATGQDISPEALAEEAPDIIAEGIGGGMVGGTLGPVMSGARYLMDSGAERYQKLKSEVVKSNEATQSAAALSTARAKLSEDKMSEQHREQMEMLIDESAIPEVPEVEPNLYDNADEVSASETSRYEEAAVAGAVEVTPSRLADFFAQEGLTVEEALQDLPQNIFEDFIKNRDTDTAVTIKFSDWIHMTEEFPAVDSIVRINGNEMTAEEATLSQEEIAENPFSLFQQRDDMPPPVPGQDVIDAPPPVPGREVVDAPPPIVEEVGEGDPVTFVDDISSRFRVEDERVAFEELRKVMRGISRRAKNIPVQAADIATEIQFRRVMNRSRITGVPAREIIEQIQAGAIDAPGVEGQLSFNRGFDGGIISMSRTANPATLIHELGHLWLNEMAVDYHQLKRMNFDEMSDAQKAYWDSMNLAAEFFELENVGQLNDLEHSKFVEIQERFAQTTEKYFLEGEFGNSTIRALMERFRSFLVSIAELVGTAYRQYPALVITPEVERMFEGILAPKVKADEVFLPLFPTPAFDVRALGPDAPKYYHDARKALGDAVSKFMSKVYQRSYRERERLANRLMNESYDEAVAIVDAMPDMVLRTEIENSYNEYRRLKKEGRPVSDPRISWSSFLDLFGGDVAAAKEVRKAARTVVAPAKKGGVDVGVIMLANGIHDAGRMRNALMNMASRDDMVQREADEILNDKLPLLKTDEEIETATNEALVEANLLTLFRSELRFMADKYLPSLMRIGEIMGKSPESWMRDDVTTEVAAEIVTKSTASKFSSRKFRNDYRQTAKDAARFFRQGNMTKAFEMKVKSIIAYKAFTQSVGVVQQLISVKKRVKQFQRFATLTDYNKVYDVDVMTFGRQFISAVLSGQRTLPKLFMPDASGLRVEIPDASGASLSDVIRVNNMIDYFVTQSEGRYGAENMSVGNTILMGEIIKMIQSTARRAKQVEVGRYQMAIEDARSNVALEVSGSVSDVRSYRSKNEGGGLADRYVLSKDQVQTALASLYRSNEEYVRSTLGRLMARVDEGQAGRNILYDDMKDRMVKAIQNAVTATRNEGGVEKFLAPMLRRVPWVGSRADIQSKDSRPIEAPELGMTFNNLSEYWMAELLMGSESGAEKFLMGRGLSQFDFDTGRVDRSRFNALRTRLIAEGVLTKEHFDMFQEIWDIFNEVHPDVKRVMRITDGRNVGKVEGEPFTVTFRDGTSHTYRGGYVPVARIDETSGASDLDILTDGRASNMSAEDLYPSRRTGMTNERNRAYYEVDLNMNLLLAYASAAADIIHMRRPLLDLGKVLKGPDVREALELKRPGAMRNVIVPWFNRVKNQERTTRTVDFVNDVAMKLRRNINRSIYLGRAVTPVIQYTGLAAGLAAIGPRFLARGMFEFNSAWGESVAFINESSEVMRNRTRGGLRRHIEDWDSISTNFDWINRADEIVDRFTFMFIQMAQNHVDRMLWLGAYQKEMAALGDHDTAVNYADFIVSSTQASSDISWLNNWQTGKSIEKLVTGIATSFVFSINNVVTREAARAPNKRARAALTVAFGLLYFGLNEAVDTALREAIEGATRLVRGEDEEDEDQHDAERLMLLTSRAAAGMLGLALPIVGAIPESMLYTGQVDFAPAFRKLGTEGTRALTGLNRASQGAPLTTREMKAILTMITTFTGIPTSALAKDIFIEDVWMEGVQGQSPQRRLEERRYIMQNNRYDRSF